MCRFLMVKSEEPFRPRRILENFAAYAERCPAPDGDRQADGWGVSWVDTAGRWRVLKSLKAIWESPSLFSKLPESAFFCVHARSASFPGHKDTLGYNQPYVNGRYAFVFNGLLQGIALSSQVPGRIGSQKIWALLAALLKDADPKTSLERLQALLNRRARRVLALNIGLCDAKNLYGICQYAAHGEYYHLQASTSPGLRMICSGPVGGFDFRPIPLGSVFVL